MKIVKSLLCCLFSFMIVCFCACSSKKPENGTSSNYNVSFLTKGRFAFAKDYDDLSDTFKDNYYDFALKMLYECEKVSGDSTMISPLSIFTALAMTANGARNNTLLQMETLIGGGIDIQSINDEIYNFYCYLNDIESDDATFDYANSVWVTDNSDFSVDLNFIDIINKRFRT